MEGDIMLSEFLCHNERNRLNSDRKDGKNKQNKQKTTEKETHLKSNINPHSFETCFHFKYKL